MVKNSGQNPSFTLDTLATQAGARAGLRDLPFVLLILLVAGAFSWNGFRNKSTTVDEVAHITAGQAYWTLQDFRLAPESGNLPDRIAALPLQFGKAVPINTESTEWKESDQWIVSREWWYDSGNEPEEILFKARMAMLSFNLLGLGLIFLLSAQLWGRGAGYFSLILAGFSPNFLGHMPLATSDFMGAWTLVLATVCYARFLDRTTWANISLAGITAGVAIITKHSGLIIGPVAVVLALWKLLNRERFIPLVLGSLAAAFIAWCVIWTAYGWRYSAGNPDVGPFTGFQVDWVTVDEGGLISRSIIEFCRTVHFLPEAFVFGLDFILSRSDRGGYLNGAYSPEGYTLFYVWNFLYKSPLPALLLHVAGWAFLLAGILKREITFKPECRGLLVLGGAYVIILLTTGMNIGYRHAFTALYISCIFASLVFTVSVKKAPAGGLVALVLVLSLPVIAALNANRYISYVNILGGGEKGGYINLTDSSLDWGQDLPAVGDYVEAVRHDDPDAEVYLCITGTGLPEYFGVPETKFLPFWGFNRSKAYFPSLGEGIYIFSATAIALMYEEWSPTLEMDYRKLKQASSGLYEGMENKGTYEVESVDPGLTIEEIQTVRQFEFYRCKRLIFYLRTRQPDEILNGTMLVYNLTRNELADLNW